MTEREKLVEIISTVKDKSGRTLGERFNISWIEMIADQLIANGVTVQEDCKACAEATNECIVKLQEKIGQR